ncbi:hypothetical protein L6R52_16000 [Myxococcota bacterium]|nr:hypothetical protein [Myxococcota bacterium]
MLSLPAQTSLDAPGPYMVDTEAARTLAIPSGDLDADVYWPVNSPEAAPVVVVGHGFARTGAALTNWGAHLASYGFVVAVPSFPSRFSPNHAANAQRMLEIIALLRTTPGAITATIDPTKSALVGHSAGGLSTFLAIASDPTVTAAVGLDPVDAMGAGVAAAASITTPTLVLGAAPSACNSQGSATALYGALTAPGSWYLRVVDSTHCDGEDPSNGTCTAVCGGQDTGRRSLYRRYATAHLLAWLRCDALEHLPNGAALMADLGAGGIAELASRGGAPSCSGVDAGVPPIDAGPRDTGVVDAGVVDTGIVVDTGVSDAGGLVPPPQDASVEDAATTPDANDAPDALVDAGSSGPADGGSSADAGTNGGLDEARGSSCTCVSEEARSPSGALLVLLAGLAVIAARRRGR